MNNYDEFVLLCISFIGSATIITTIFKHLKIPTQVGLILSGVFIGPYGAGIIKDIPITELISELAIILLMFCLGLEFSLYRLKKMTKDFLILGPLQVFVTTLVVYLACFFLLKQGMVKSLLWGFFVSLSSTALVLKLLQSSRRDNASYANTTIATLLFQDLAVIPIMLLVNVVRPDGSLGLVEVSYSSFLGSFVLFVVTTYLLARYIVPFIIEKVAIIHSREVLFYSIFFVCFGIAYFTHYCGLSYPIGAFIAGLILSESPYGKHALAEFKLLRDNFLGIFFISIGLLIDPFVFLSNVPRVMIYTVLILTGKSTIIFLIMMALRYPKRHAIMVALILFQVGEFSFLLASIAVSKGLLPIKDMQLFLTLSVTTLMATPFMFRYLPKISSWLLNDHKRRPHEMHQEDEDNNNEKLFQDEVLIIGLGYMGIELCKKLHRMKVPFKVIEQNFNNFSKHKYDWPIFFGDATSKALLEDIGASNVRLAIVGINNADIIDLIVNNLREENPMVHIFVRLNYIEEEHLHLKIYDENIKFFISEREVTKRILDAVIEHFDESPDK